MNFERVCKQVFERMMEASFSGYDPSSVVFDKRVRAIDLFIKSIRFNFIRKVCLSMFYQAIFWSGHWFVKWLKPNKVVFTKGLALVLTGLAWKKNNAMDSRAYIDKITNEILSRRIGERFLWGHDIEYVFPDGTEVLPNTPNLVTSAFVANAFWEMYMVDDCERYKTYFEKTVLDLIDAIPFRHISNDQICYMYTPATKYCVHNANLLFVELLVKYLKLNPERYPCFESSIERALNYTLTDFDRTSTYPYAGPPTENNSIDNYHTGYLLRSLSEIRKYSSWCAEKFVLASRINDLLKFYISNFVGDYVFFKPQFMLQSHSLAESILVLCEFQDFLEPEQKNLFMQAIKRTLRLLWNENDNFFYNNAKFLGPLKIYDKTEMIRWSNAWMFYALAKLSEKDTLK